jgi:uncharacterized protein (UPF0303 family)
VGGVSPSNGWFPDVRVPALRGGPVLRWGVLAPGEIAGDLVATVLRNTDHRDRAPRRPGPDRLPVHGLDDAIGVLQTTDAVRAQGKRARMTIEPPDLDRFDLDDAWRLGSTLTERCRSEGLAVTISIRLGEQRAFHAALPGASADNDSWVDRKSRVVRRFDCSSHEVHTRHAKGDADRFYADFALSPSQYAPAGGAVPIRVRGTLVGVLAVSGLESGEDHELAVSALVEHARRP